MKITDHIIEEANSDRKSPNTGGSLTADTIVVHYTAGRDAKSSVDTLVNPGVKASAHLVVGRKGEILQLVPFDVIAWHAGRSHYKGRKGYNKYSIGIEIDNAGVLAKSGEVYRSWFGAIYPQDQVIRAVHRNQNVAKYWHAYTDEQIFAVEEICRVLVEAYPIKDILGHEEISPTRKIDPGPAFPLDKLRRLILNPDRSQDEGELDDFPVDGAVTASKLNIRENPSTNSRKVAAPLKRKKQVTVLAEQDGWYEVEVKVKGWVSAKYVELDS